MTAIEIKSGETMNQDFLNGLRYDLKLRSTLKTTAYLIYGEKNQEKGDFQLRSS